METEILQNIKEETDFLEQFMKYGSWSSLVAVAILLYKVLTFKADILKQAKEETQEVRSELKEDIRELKEDHKDLVKKGDQHYKEVMQALRALPNEIVTHMKMYRGGK